MNKKNMYIPVLIMVILVGLGTFFVTRMYMNKSNIDKSNLNSSSQRNSVLKNKDNSQNKDNESQNNIDVSKSLDSSTNTNNGTNNNASNDTASDITNAAANNNDVGGNEEKVSEVVGTNSSGNQESSKADALENESDEDDNLELNTNSNLNVSQVNISGEKSYIDILTTNTTMKVGEKITLEVDGSSDGVVYSSENDSVVVVDDKGMVTALRIGSAKVSVSLLGKTDSIIINVIDSNTDGIGNSDSQASKNNSNEEKKQSVKNGWINENGKRYYYKNGNFVVGWKKIDGDKYYFNKNGVMLKDTYVDYHYLKPNGKKKDKVGQFSATLYGATAWPNQTLNVRNKASENGQIISSIPAGKKVKIISDVNSSTGYIKVRRGNIIGYVLANNLMINLPDVIPDMYYSISNANKSKFKAAGARISGITGENLYGFEKKYNAKIDKNAYYAPMLYPVAVQLQSAYRKAVKQGYNLKVYDTYRPYDVSMKVASNLRSLYNSNASVRNKIDYDADGNYWGQGWFIAQGVSGHNRGTDIDLALTDSNGRELSAQSPMHTLDTSSLVKYNNNVSNKLRSIMTSVGFETLKSEWWHFQEDSYRTSPYVSFKLK